MVSDRLLLDLQYAHVGNNFTLGLQSPDLRQAQPTFIISTGLNGRSALEQVFIRPVNSLTMNTNHLMPGFLGGDHQLRVGGHWRNSNTTSISHSGGFATARYPNAIANDCTVARDRMPRRPQGLRYAILKTALRF